MMAQDKPALPAIRIAAFLVAACGMCACNYQPPPTALPTSFEPPGTAFVRTIEARLTELAHDFTATPTQPFTPSSTPQPSAGPTDTAMIASSATATAQPSATPSPISTATATSIPCNRVGFVTDVSVPDGTVFSPGVAFTKIWRLRNDGRCTWTNSYNLVFVDGERMGGDEKISFKGTVKPGQTIDLSLDLTAPAKAGEYQGFWALRGPDGVDFGLGERGEEPFWVDIEVRSPNKTVYDLLEHYCEAAWHSGAGDMQCPGNPSSTTGFVLEVDEAKLENRTTENEPVLWTQPQTVEDGLISGEYPAFKVKAGDHFKTVIGCLYDAETCQVMFQLNYREEDGPIQNLATWTETYDRHLTHVDLDLSRLAGKQMHFILTVLAIGDPTQDAAFWLVPRIVR
jgi:hypothetical protein